MPTGTNPRTYDVATETLNGLVNPNQLLNELEADAALPGAPEQFVNTSRPPGEPNPTTLDIGWQTLTPTAAQITAQDAVVAAHPGTATTSDDQVWEKGGIEDEGSSGNWTSYMLRTADPMAGGRYRVDMQCEMRIVLTGGANTDAQVRYVVAGNNKGISWMPEGTTEWVICNFFDRFRVDEGEEPTFEIEYRSQGGNDTVEVRRGKIALTLVSPTDPIVE